MIPEDRLRDMEETGGASAYGAPLAGGGFDFYKFIRQPQTIVRVLSWVFALVVFACITTEGHINSVHSSEVYCIFNQNNSACQYAVGIGVIAFLACVAFLVLDVYLPFMSNSQERKYAVMADLGFSGAWTFLWFVCFCLLASLWGRTHDVSGIPEDAARATVAFSFFSIATWGILTYFALCRFRRGVSEVTLSTYTEPQPELHTPYPPTYAPTSYNPTTYTPTTYSVYPNIGPDVRQQPLNPQPQGDAGYQPPNY
ncbi:synaptogyrin-2b [Betta splendens]|uniref:Synaptogyrin n=1 Tax=Betta splendens TaxID=158456 RepID=A0A6P7MQ07_BETSP|nr:synaptogyrin-2b [Betta splendens]XP_055359070.1 synaptogyrin-2b [Betta splendens]